MTTSSSFGSTTSMSLTGSARKASRSDPRKPSTLKVHLDVLDRERTQGFQERSQEAFHFEGPQARRGLDELYARRKIGRRRPVLRQMHSHAAGGEPADFLHRAKQHEFAFAQQGDAIAGAVNFR